MFFGICTPQLEPSFRNKLLILMCVFASVEITLELTFEALNKNAPKAIDSSQKVKTKGYLLKSRNGLRELIFYFQNVMLLTALVSIGILVTIF